MELFAERYIHVPSKTWFEGRQHLLWPVHVWKVLFPAEDQVLGANLFQEAVLGLMRAGVRDPAKLAELLALHPELVRFIVATQLQPNGWVDSASRILPAGESVLDEAEDSRLKLKVGYAFQDAVSGAWLPRFLIDLSEIVPAERNSKGRPVFLLDRETGRAETPFVLPHSQGAHADVAGLADAYRGYRKDLADARRDDHAIEPGLQFQAIETLGEEATPMYLWCELYRDEAESQPWLVSDPFRLQKAASWLRKPLLDLAPRNPGLIRKMQQLLKDSAEECTAEEWLNRIDEDVELKLLREYPFLDKQALICDHLGRLLRQRTKIEKREWVNAEDLAILMGEAHNMIEAVLKCLLRKWPIDTKCWPKKKSWSRDEAKEVFASLGLACVSSRLIDQLAGQSLGVIGLAIRSQDRPLKALLAGVLFCAAECPDHPFRESDPGALALERLPSLADFRNEVSGHASGKKASLDEVLESTRFAIQWMAQFQHWY